MYTAFLVTYKCTAECKHCLYQSSPRRNALISLEDVRSDLIALKANWPIEATCFVGGEPLLYFELLTSLVREVKAQGITCAILTNAFWGEDQAIARRYVGALKDAGLDEMHISVDAFHQEFVPFDAVKEVIQASKDAGIGHIAVNAKSLGDPDMDNSYNRQTKRSLEELSEEYDGRINFAKVDVDQNPQIASRYGIMGIPTLILFKDGKPVSNIVGFRPKAELKQSLDAALE